MFVSQGGENRILVFQLNDEGLPTKETADYAIGEPSLYGRKQPLTTSMASPSEGAGLSGIAYDSVHDRIVARDGSRLLMFDVRPDHMKNGLSAIAVFGKPTFASRLGGGVGPKLVGSIDGTVLDVKNQRLFVSDGRNNRIMIWDIDPAKLTATPDPLAVIGQTDYTSRTSGAGPDHLTRPGSLFYDDANDRLFVSDSGNNRILVFNVAPQKLQTGIKADAVIGQANFDDHEAGIGATRLNDPARLAHDPLTQRLFVGDGGNERILVYDVAPDKLKNGMAASYVFGQDDFDSRKTRTNLKKAMGLGSLQIDSKRQRLYLTEPINHNRALVFDINPSHMRNNPDAVAVLFQQSFDKIDWNVSRTEETWPRPFLDAADGKLYVAASQPGGNRVSIFDISGPIKPTGMPSITTMGQFNDDGSVDFSARAASGRVNGRVFYPRLLTLDPVDHRLFVGDQYNSRVLVYQLDPQNRILSRTATVVLGQPDVYTANLWDISARNMEIPHALAYDRVNKWLFVADGWHDRVLIFDADPKRMKTYEDAMFVLGQPDFKTIKPGAGATGVNFEIIGESRGIGGDGTAPVALAVDSQARRLFVSDGGNNRVLVYDLRPGNLKNGAAAINVIGQPDFQRVAPTPAGASETTGMATGEETPSYSRGGIYSAEVGEGEGGGAGRKNRVANDHGFDSPAGLSFDAKRNRLFVVDGNNARVLVFDVTPSKMKNGMSAVAVIGQKDFTGGNGTRLNVAKVGDELGRRRFILPSSVAYDPLKDWLYITDRGNERTLIFDAAPDKLQNDPGAIGVLGKDNYTTDVVTRAEQEELIEPRELAIDSEHQRIFQTDTPMSRVVVYDLPRTEKTIDVAARGMMNYSTTDPWNGRDKPDLDKRKTWRAEMKGAAGSADPGAFLTYTKTQQFLDAASERRSRILISETSVAAPAPSDMSMFYMDQGEGKDHVIIVSNPNSQPTDVDFHFGDTDQAKRTIPAEGRLDVLASQLFGSGVQGKAAVLKISGQQPVAAVVLRRTHTSRGEDLVMAVPPVESLGTAAEATVPGIAAGGGYESELVLVNPLNEAVSGHIQVLDQRSGESEGWAQSSDLSYNLSPGGAYHLKLTSPSYLPERAFAVVHGDQGTKAPWAAAFVRISKDSLLLSETAIPARPGTHVAWMPVETLPDLIRHGETPSIMNFTIADATPTPALLRFTLFDSDGKEHARYEQILPPGTQRNWSLADLFNVEAFNGTVRLFSDVPVAISDTRVTETLRGEPFESEIGYMDMSAPKNGEDLELPSISDGAGIATDIVFVNPEEKDFQGQMKFESADGHPSEIVLR